jgi:hypothetical protein
VSPPRATLTPTAQQGFGATLSGSPAPAVNWAVKEGDSGGTITATGLFTAPSTTGTYTVVAVEPTSGARGEAVVTVVPTVQGGAPPSIASFFASPATLPQGGGTATLSWEVSGANTIAIDNGIGSVTGGSRSVAVTATTVFTMTASNSSGTTTASTAVIVGVSSGAGHNPPDPNSRYVAMVAPVAGETFTAPASLRLIAAAHDPNVYNNYPVDGRGGNASKVQFFVDGTLVLEVDGSQAEYWVFKGFVDGIAAGTHSVWARAVYTNPALTLDSAPMTIDVAAPTYGQTVDLAGDLSIGSSSYSLVGTPTARVRVNGNGHRVTASGSTAIVFRYVDFFDVGDRATTSAPGIDLTTSGSLDVQNCVFDSSNTVQFSLGGAAQAAIKGNTFRSNMRQPLGQGPDGGQGWMSNSYPAVVLQGASTGTKVFSGNNVGAGWVQLRASARSWLIGGSTNADSNVLIGPRIGINADNTTQDIQIRRNYSHHIYYGGWSQGNNYELGGVSTLTAEHNVIAGSSWPVRSVGGEFRYNLVLDAGHQWLWADKTNAYIHHNVFIGGSADVAGVYALYNVAGIRIQNNTFDGMNATSIVAAVKQTAGSISLTSNLFLNVPVSPVNISGGSMSADYNLFWNTASPSYSDNRSPGHDVHGDPRLASPTAYVYDFDEAALWQRSLQVHDVLAQYRTKYTPTGSAALDVGDPAGGAGNDIGAIGGGASNAADEFGK